MINPINNKRTNPLLKIFLSFDRFELYRRGLRGALFGITPKCIFFTPIRADPMGDKPQSVSNSILPKYIKETTKNITQALFGFFAKAQTFYAPFVPLT